MRLWEHCLVHSFSRRWTLLVLPIFKRMVPGVLEDGLVVNAFKLSAARMASLTLRPLVCGCGGKSEEAMSEGGGEGAGGVTQNI